MMIKLRWLNWLTCSRPALRAAWNRGRLLPLFLLTTPFLVFLDHNGVCIVCPEVLLSLFIFTIVAMVCSLGMRLGWLASSLILIGLLMFFLDLQFQWMKSNYALFGLVVSFFALIWAFRENFYLIATTVAAVMFIATLIQLPFRLWLRPTLPTVQILHRQLSIPHCDCKPYDFGYG